MLCEKLLLALLPGERGPRQNVLQGSSSGRGAPSLPPAPTTHRPVCAPTGRQSIVLSVRVGCLCVYVHVYADA